MPNIKQEVTKALLRPAIAVGCAIIGCAFVDFSGLMWPILAGIVVLGSIAGVVYVRARFYAPDAASLPVLQQRVQTGESARYVQDLFSPYTQCAAQAAEQLGQIGDAAVVPSLISVLDRSAWRDEPGWDQVCETIVLALAAIGDGRALPALNRISGARGPEFRDMVDSAVASITDMQRRDTGQPVGRSLNAQSDIALNSGPRLERTTTSRVALIPLGDESAFEDSVSL
jgi:hypothetical protein